MTANKTAKPHTTAESIANTFEWLITAFVLAFVFRAFVLEAFRIPTGSMADTLMGDHYRICCTQCGYEYEYNFNPRQKSAVGDGYHKLIPSPRCPSCGYYENPNTLVSKSNGDRILVLKCIYQFIEPNRWDVFVFKNPTNPKENYIKRLLAKPGETIEIIDGDVYINDVLARKPEKVQDEMWMSIYDNNYQPARPLESGRFNGHAWHQPFVNAKNSQWKQDPNRPTEFTLQSRPNQTNILFYDTNRGNDFRAAYAYGNPRYYKNLPYCSDLMMNCYAQMSAEATIGIGLKKYGTLYKAYINADRKMVIEKIDSAGNTTELTKSENALPIEQKPVFVQFANVDHELIFKVGKEKLIYDLGTGKYDAGKISSHIKPAAIIFGSGSLKISHVKLYRDIHYLNQRQDNLQPINRAGQGEPFTLSKDEFFAMGDNSPDSLDSRLWETEGLGNNGKHYRTGVVPRNYLVGKAFFVYWPGGLRTEKFRHALIPNVGKMRFIHGGQAVPAPDRVMNN